MQLFQRAGGRSGQRRDDDPVQIQKPVAVLELVGQAGAGDTQQLGQECTGHRSATAQDGREEPVEVVRTAGLRVEAAAWAVEASLQELVSRGLVIRELLSGFAFDGRGLGEGCAGPDLTRDAEDEVLAVAFALAPTGVGEAEVDGAVPVGVDPVDAAFATACPEANSAVTVVPDWVMPPTGLRAARSVLSTGCGPRPRRRSHTSRASRGSGPCPRP